MKGLAGDQFEAVLHKLLILCEGGPSDYRVTSIFGIIEKRMTHVLKMSPDLMGTPGFQLDPDMGMPVIFMDYAVVGDRRFTIPDDCHALSVHWMSTQRLINCATCHHHPIDYRFVFTSHRS